MNPEQKIILRNYSELKIKIKALEAQADELNPFVLESLQVSGAEEVDIEDLGKIVLANRRTWEYPAEIKEKEDTVKAEKKEAEQLGTAKYSEKPYILFKQNKE